MTTHPTDINNARQAKADSRNLPILERLLNSDAGPNIFEFSEIIPGKLAITRINDLPYNPDTGIIVFPYIAGVGLSQVTMNIDYQNGFPLIEGEAKRGATDLSWGEEKEFGDTDGDEFITGSVTTFLSRYL